jgi:hypothetical protein
VCDLPLRWCWQFFIILGQIFLFGMLSCEKKKKQFSFFLKIKLGKTNFCPKIVKNGQHQHKDRPHIRKISERCNFCGGCNYNIKILNLCGVHCRMRHLMIKAGGAVYVMRCTPVGAQGRSLSCTKEHRCLWAPLHCLKIAWSYSVLS